MNTTGPITITFKPPLNDQAAADICLLGADAWNSGDAKQIIALFADKAQWQNRHLHLTSKTDIADYLNDKNILGLHYSTLFELWNYSQSRLSLRFKSEWQHTKSGQWYRSNGTALVALNIDGLIHRLTLDAHDTLINANDRSIGLTRGETHETPLYWHPFHSVYCCIRHTFFGVCTGANTAQYSPHV